MLQSERRHASSLDRAHAENRELWVARMSRAKLSHPSLIAFAGRCRVAGASFPRSRNARRASLGMARGRLIDAGLGTR